MEYFTKISCFYFLPAVNILFDLDFQKLIGKIWKQKIGVTCSAHDRDHFREVPALEEVDNTPLNKRQKQTSYIFSFLTQ